MYSGKKLISGASKNFTIDLSPNSRGGVITPIEIKLPIGLVRLLKELLQDEKRRRELNSSCPSYLKTMYDKEILFLKSKLDPYEAN